MKGDEDEEAADLARGLAGFGTESLADGTDDGADDAAAAGRVGGDEGGEDEVGERDGIAKGERRFAEFLDEEVRDAKADFGLGDGAGKEERGEDEPDGGIGKTGEDVGGGQGAGEDERGHGGEDGGAHGHGLGDEGNDGGNKESDEMPLGWVENGEWDEVDEEPGYQGGGPAPGSIGSVHVVNAILSYALRLAIGEDFVTVAGE